MCSRVACMHAFLIAPRYVSIVQRETEKRKLAFESVFGIVPGWHRCRHHYLLDRHQHHQHHDPYHLQCHRRPSHSLKLRLQREQHQQRGGKRIPFSHRIHRLGSSVAGKRSHFLHARAGDGHRCSHPSPSPITLLEGDRPAQSRIVRCHLRSPCEDASSQSACDREARRLRGAVAMTRAGVATRAHELVRRGQRQWH